jgi:transposase
LTTKVHALADALGNPVNLMLTPGQDHDLTCAEPLLENADPDALLCGFRRSRPCIPI